MNVDTNKRVKPYPDPPQTRQRLALETYEYHMPFNYPNITVDRRYMCGPEFHGVEMAVVNSITGRDAEHLGPDTITIVETEPIVRVVVIGSACVPPGFVQLEAKPLKEFYKAVDVPGASAVRYRLGNLWGMHPRFDQWQAQSEAEIRDHTGQPYSEIPDARIKNVWGIQGDHKYKLKSHYRENPLVGMSSATFEIPKSREVIISGGCEPCAWTDDSFPDDVHYSFRMIRITVAARTEEA